MDEQLYTHLNAYINNIGGIKNLSSRPNPEAIFIPFIEEGIATGNREQALLGTALQAYVNDCRHSGKPEDYWSKENSNLNNIIKGNDVCTDALSYTLLFEALLNDKHPKKVEYLGPTLADTLGKLIDYAKNSPGITEEWKKLVKKYHPSPFDDKDVAVVGNTEPFPAFLFKSVRLFNCRAGFLEPKTAQLHAQSVDAVIDCNACNETREQARLLPQLCAKITRPGGLIVHDTNYDSRADFNGALGDDDFHENVLSQQIIKNSYNVMVLKQQPLNAPLPYEKDSRLSARTP